MIREAIATAVALIALQSCGNPERDQALADPCGLEQVIHGGFVTEQLRSCAARGDLRSQTYLAAAYWSEAATRYPDPVERGIDPTWDQSRLRGEGLRLMQDAAARGGFEAQNELGLAHLEGLYGVPQDSALAFNLFTAADAQNDPIAAYNLARMHYAGIGIPKSESDAERLLWRSAALGYQPALCSLALLREKAGAIGSARAIRLAARGLDEFFYACSHDHSDISDEFR